MVLQLTLGIYTRPCFRPQIRVWDMLISLKGQKFVKGDETLFKKQPKNSGISKFSEFRLHDFQNGLLTKNRMDDTSNLNATILLFFCEYC